MYFNFTAMKKTLLFATVSVICQIASAQSWQNRADVPVDMAFPVVVELRGNIHVMGGGAVGGATNLHLRYKPSTDKWDTMPPVPYLAQQPAGAVVNGKIHYCGGGYPNSGTPLSDHYYFDPDSNKWFAATKLPVALAIHKAFGLNKKLYVLSGQPDKLLFKCYDPATKKWLNRNALPDQNFWYSAIVGTSQTIFRFGGGGYLTPTDAAMYYDTLNDGWIDLPNLPMPIHAVSASNLGDSMICIAGGYSNNKIINKCWLYDIKKQRYFVSDTLPYARDYHSMVTAGGCVYSVGGDNPNQSSVSVSLIKNCSPQKLSLVTGLERISHPPDFIVSQSAESIFIQLQETAINKSYTLSLLDVTGRTALPTQNIAGSSFELSTQTLAAGMYVLVLQNAESTFTQKLLINK